MQLPESTVEALMEYRRAQNIWLGSNPATEEALEAYHSAAVKLAIDINIEYGHFGEEDQ